MNREKNLAHFSLYAHHKNVLSVDQLSAQYEIWLNSAASCGWHVIQVENWSAHRHPMPICGCIFPTFWFMLPRRLHCLSLRLLLSRNFISFTLMNIIWWAEDDNDNEDGDEKNQYFTSNYSRSRTFHVNGNHQAKQIGTEIPDLMDLKPLLLAFNFIWHASLVCHQRSSCFNIFFFDFLRFCLFTC